MHGVVDPDFRSQAFARARCPVDKVAANLQHLPLPATGTATDLAVETVNAFKIDHHALLSGPTGKIMEIAAQQKLRPRRFRAMGPDHFQRALESRLVAATGLYCDYLDVTQPEQMAALDSAAIRRTDYTGDYATGRSLLERGSVSASKWFARLICEYAVQDNPFGFEQRVRKLKRSSTAARDIAQLGTDRLALLDTTWDTAPPSLPTAGTEKHGLYVHTPSFADWAQTNQPYNGTTTDTFNQPDVVAGRNSFSAQVAIDGCPILLAPNNPLQRGWEWAVDQAVAVRIIR